MGATGFWLNYDLGIDGDYDGLYAWLDSVEAKECGDGSCFFDPKKKMKNPPKEILAAIKKMATIRSKDRLYIIWSKSGERRLAGRFISGSRRRAPWAGFAIEASGGGEDAG
jgi:hypothetical protein